MNSAIRMITGIGVAQVVVCLTGFEPLNPITLPATEECRQAGEEGAAKQGDEGPQRGPGRSLCRSIRSLLGFDLGLLQLRIDLINACFGLGLGQASALGHHLGQVGPVLRRKRAALSQRAGQNTRCHTICSVVTDRHRALSTEQAIDEVAHRVLALAVAASHARSGSCSRSGHSGGAGAQQVASSTEHQHGRHERGNRPRQEAMCSVPKIHFITVQVGPFHPQATGDMMVEIPSALALAPSSAQGEVAARPNPVPSTNRIRDKAAAAAAPANIAAQETPERLGSLVG
ncbi:hypothetical protein WR25_03826 [Diploscapter pachys]|uniref:Uncharacterized protein n=1 Tax=Diploscapter pachys TaxID=2018661 RepID=A0A2A2K752_9BILA|nr:hypothetical protein WR25_03826 [Diploscapter pachys]